MLCCSHAANVWVLCLLRALPLPPCRRPRAAPAAVNASPEAQQQATFTLDDNDDPKAP